MAVGWCNRIAEETYLHSSNILCIVYSPDLDALVTASEDGTIRIHWVDLVWVPSYHNLPGSFGSVAGHYQSGWLRIRESLFSYHVIIYLAKERLHIAMLFCSLYSFSYEVEFCSNSRIGRKHRMSMTRGLIFDKYSATVCQLHKQFSRSFG